MTCEHGGNAVPRDYRHLFADETARAALRSHRGWDPGALRVGRALARGLEAPYLATEVTRLLVDVNRTSERAGLFSEFSRELPADHRAEILRRYHTPHWQAVEAALREALDGGPVRLPSRRGRISPASTLLGSARSARDPRARTSRPGTSLVLHVASHSFTDRPGRIGYPRPPRGYEVGLLFDPRRAREAQFVRLWRREMVHDDPALDVRLNQPYRGWTDGMTTVFRGRLGSRYLGIELECNQVALADAARARRIERVLISSLRRAIALVTMGRTGTAPVPERRKRA